MTDLGFIHRYLPGRNAAGPVLLLLHGTGGDENDLIPLGQDLLPGAAILSVRGKVLENGMPRFFRRLAEGVFDQDDLRRRTEELGQFIDSARRQYSLSENRLIAVGYSNGANIAASLILREPDRLSGSRSLSTDGPVCAGCGAGPQRRLDLLERGEERLNCPGGEYAPVVISTRGFGRGGFHALA